MVVLAHAQLAAAAIIYESAALGPTGLGSSDLPSGCACPEVRGGQFVGVRFEVTATTTARAIGGHFGPLTGTGDLFGALVLLSGPGDFPDSADLSSPDLLSYAALSVPGVSAEVSGFFPTPVSLSPGWYALVFGSDALGLPQYIGFAPGVDVEIGNPSFFHQTTSGSYQDSAPSTISNQRFFLSTVGAGGPLQFEISQITQGGLDTSPVADETYVYWIREEANGDGSVMRWHRETNTTINLISDAAYKGGLRVSDGRLVWSEWYGTNNSDIFYWDGQFPVSPVRVTNDGCGDGEPSILGTQIVWIQWCPPGGPYKVQFFDFGTWDGQSPIVPETIVTHGSSGDRVRDPDISSTTVVYNYDPFGPSNDILYYWDIASETFSVAVSQLPIPPSPRISGSITVYQTYDGDGEVALWTGASSVPLTDNDVVEGSAVISGLTVAWSEQNPGGTYDVVVWNGAEWDGQLPVSPGPVRLTQNATSMTSHPTGISSNSVVWHTYDYVSETYELFHAHYSPEPDSTPIDYVALGDSFSAGEGARQAGAAGYIAGTDELGLNECHRSGKAYPNGISVPLEDDRIAFTEGEFIACSGAATKNIRSGFSYAGVGEGQWNDLPQLDQVIGASQTTVLNPTTDLVTLTIGGNDAGFAGVMLACAMQNFCDTPLIRFLLSGGVYDFAAETTARIDKVEVPLRETLCEIKGRAPNASIWISGYPQLFNGNGVRYDPPTPGVEFEVGEINQLRMKVSEFNDLIEDVADMEGVHLVDRTLLDTLFDQRGLNQPSGSSMKSFFTGPMFRPVAEWFHPTEDGQGAIADAFELSIAAATDDPVNGLLASGLPRNPVGTDPIAPGTCTAGAGGGAGAGPLTPPLLIETLSIEPVGAPACDAGLSYVPSQMARLTGRGFAPSSSVELRIATGGEAFTAILGTTTSDLAGAIDAVVTIPAGINIDGAGVSAIGTTPEGGPLVLLTPIEIVASITGDTDLDSVPDACDNCAGISNSGQLDTDGDYIGDVCDVCPNDVNDDGDGDGLCADVDACPLDPDNDRDQDGLCAGEDADNDGDALEDWRETKTGVFLDASNTGTDPDDPDSDGDGFDDGVEVLAGSDPLSPLSTPLALPALSWSRLLLLGALMLGAGVVARPRARLGR